MKNGPLRRNCYSYLNEEVFNVMFVHKICFKKSFEGYRNMMPENLQNDLINFSVIKTNQSWGNNQPVAVLNAEDNIFVEMV